MSLHPNPISQDRSSGERRCRIHCQDGYARSFGPELFDQPVHQRAFSDPRASRDSKYKGLSRVRVELPEKLLRRVGPDAGFEARNRASDRAHVSFQESLEQWFDFRGVGFDEELLRSEYLLQ